jgi:hypothetical protein
MPVEILRVHMKPSGFFDVSVARFLSYSQFYGSLNSD